MSKVMFRVFVQKCKGCKNLDKCISGEKRDCPA